MKTALPSRKETKTNTRKKKTQARKHTSTNMHTKEQNKTNKQTKKKQQQQQQQQKIIKLLTLGSEVVTLDFSLTHVLQAPNTQLCHS